MLVGEAARLNFFADARTCRVARITNSLLVAAASFTSVELRAAENRKTHVVCTGPASADELQLSQAAALVMMMMLMGCWMLDGSPERCQVWPRVSQSVSQFEEVEEEEGGAEGERKQVMNGVEPVAAMGTFLRYAKAWAWEDGPWPDSGLVLACVPGGKHLNSGGHPAAWPWPICGVKVSPLRGANVPKHRPCSWNPDRP